jgi:hypothetical protein
MAKIAASQQADRVRANIAILDQHAEHATLFADRVSLCASKAPEDLRNLVSARIAEHKQREDQRLEQERERIRQEETDKLARQVQEDAARAERERAQAARNESLGNVEAAAAVAPTAAATVLSGTAQFVPIGGAVASLNEQSGNSGKFAATGARIKLGDINARIAPMSVTADGLAKLGFQSVGTERAAKLYSEAQFPDMCRAMGRVLRDALDLDQAA